MLFNRGAWVNSPKSCLQRFYAVGCMNIPEESWRAAFLRKSEEEHFRRDLPERLTLQGACPLAASIARFLSYKRSLLFFFQFLSLKNLSFQLNFLKIFKLNFQLNFGRFECYRCVDYQVQNQNITFTSLLTDESQASLRFWSLQFGTPKQHPRDL